MAERSELHYAIVDGQIDLACSLIESGVVDVNSQDDVGYTPLHAAAQYGMVEVVRLLLGKGVKVDLVDSWGNTPLWRALGAGEKKREIVDLLIKAGVNPAQKNFSGISVLSHVTKIANHPNRDQFYKWIQNT